MKALYEAGALTGDIGEMVAAAVQGGAKVDATTQADFAATNVVLDEFLAADIVVLGAPMYNFGIPSQLKAWIDCLASPGKTFNYTATGVAGLAGGKKLIIALVPRRILQRLLSDGLYGSSGDIPNELLRLHRHHRRRVRAC
jgi:FMN-dependent NADH-azoreductase